MEPPGVPLCVGLDRVVLFGRMDLLFLEIAWPIFLAFSAASQCLTTYAPIVSNASLEKLPKNAIIDEPVGAINEKGLSVPSMFPYIGV